MDETPIKAGRVKRRDKMKTAWCWPLYGEDDEVVFRFSPSHARAHVDKVLATFAGTLLSDGAPLYEQFTRSRPELVHAQCWSHTRRKFVEAETLEPNAVAEAFDLIGALYEVEAHIRDNELDVEQALAYRAEPARVGVDAFFAWCHEQCQRIELTPSNPLAKALRYAQAREGGALRIYLTDPPVAIDTNHLERALRPIPMGRNYDSPVIMQGCCQATPHEAGRDCRGLRLRFSGAAVIGGARAKGVSCGLEPCIIKGSVRRPKRGRRGGMLVVRSAAAGALVALVPSSPDWLRRKYASLQGFGDRATVL